MSGKFYREKARRQATRITKARRIFPYSRKKLHDLIHEITPKEGAVGPSGPTGAAGETGPTCPDGYIGAVGTQGATSTDQGETGADSSTQGETSGNQGATSSEQGEIGEQGAAGADSEVGGASSSDQGVQGEEASSLQGPQGATSSNQGVDGEASSLQGPASSLQGPASSAQGEEGEEGGQGSPSTREGETGPDGVSCFSPSGISFSGTNPTCQAIPTAALTITCGLDSKTCTYASNPGEKIICGTDPAANDCEWECQNYTSGGGGGDGGYSCFCCAEQVANCASPCSCGGFGGGMITFQCVRWDKTAIVKLLGKYRKLYATEQPTVRFEDTFVCRMSGYSEGSFIIDPIFVEACEPNSIYAIAFMPSTPALVGGVVENGVVKVKVKELLTHFPKIPELIRVTISGIRKGFGEQRFDIASYDEVRRNSVFYNQQRKIIEAARAM